MPIALIAIACCTCVRANAVPDCFVNRRAGALGIRMKANQMIRATSIPSPKDVAPATPITHRRNVAPMIEMTRAATNPGAGFPSCSCFNPRAAVHRRPKTGGENQIAPMIHALTPAITIAIQLKLDTSKDTMAPAPPGDGGGGHIRVPVRGLPGSLVIRMPIVGHAREGEGQARRSRGGH